VFFAPLTAENKVCFFSPEPPEAHARTPRVKKAKVKDPFNLTPLFAQALGQYSGGFILADPEPAEARVGSLGKELPEPPEAHAGSLGKGC
ncbi:hypothetical protein GGF50DRAFT_121325, partial [Schizophyllum commune]